MYIPDIVNQFEFEFNGCNLYLLYFTVENVHFSNYYSIFYDI